MKKFGPIRALLVLALACIAHAAPAQQSPWIVADFNGDHKADLVSVNSLGEPGIQFSAGHVALPSLTPRFASHLRARDLDGDNDRDLILETASSFPLAIWLNDGAGHFARANIEDYRFQLSHESSQTFSGAITSAPPTLTDDGPRSAVLQPPGYCSPQPPSSSLCSLASAAHRVGRRFLIRTRGPPPSSL